MQSNIFYKSIFVADWGSISRSQVLGRNLMQACDLNLDLKTLKIINAENVLL